jgi:hypothetical protein
VAPPLGPDLVVPYTCPTSGLFLAVHGDDGFPSRSIGRAVAVGLGRPSSFERLRGASRKLSGRRGGAGHLNIEESNLLRYNDITAK